ncbi:MAG: MFS transporter [Dehalococcoidia bacterium]|nr:MFS transporter [Dehalococcoidia bacterium]
MANVVDNVVDNEQAQHDRSGVPFASLRNRDFLFYWIGGMASFLGMQMQQVAQGWLVLDLTDSPFYLGLVGAISSAPILFLSLFGGVVADRLDRRNLLVVAQGLMALPALGIGYLAATGAIEIWHLIGLSAIIGGLAAFVMPARQAYMSDLVQRRELVNAIALNSAGLNLTRVIGPSLGGLLIASAGVAGAYFLSGATGIVIVFTLLLIPSRGAVGQPNGQSVWSNIAEGLRYIRKNELVLISLSFGAIVVIFGLSYQLILPVFARDVYFVGAEGLGFLMAAAGGGALCCSLAIASLGNVRRKGFVMFASGAGLGAGLILFAISPSFTVALVMQFLIGAVSVTAMSMNNTIIQMVVPNELRGRVMSVMMLTFGLMPIGSLLIGGIASIAGASLAVTLSGGVVLLSAVSLAFLSQGVRRLD